MPTISIHQPRRRAELLNSGVSIEVMRRHVSTETAQA
jgi:hypothetical protein